MKATKKTIIFAGGGTGGHFYPLIAIIRAFQKMASHWQIYYVFPDKNTYNAEAQKENIYSRRIVSGKLRRYFSIKNFAFPFKVFYGLCEALVFIYKTKPKIVFLKGGYGALPIGLAALFWHVPIVLHESDIELGLINRFFAHWAKLILVSFRETKKYLAQNKKVFVVGNPVRGLDCRSGFNQEAERKKMGFRRNKPIILVLGGSQGASEINELIFDLLDKLVVRFYIIHSIGKKGFQDFEQRFQERFGSRKKILENYHFYPYLKEKNICRFYLLSDIIISRAGSGAIFEIANAGKPAILIPLQGSASDHQRKNAYAYMAHNACVVIEKPNLKRQFFLSQLIDLVQNSEKMELMRQGAKKFARPDSAEQIARLLLTLS